MFARFALLSLLAKRLLSITPPLKLLMYLRFPMLCPMLYLLLDPLIYISGLTSGALHKELALHILFYFFFLFFSASGLN